MLERGTDAVPYAAPGDGLVLQQPLEGLRVGGEDARGAELLGVREAAQQPAGGETKGPL